MRKEVKSKGRLITVHKEEERARKRAKKRKKDIKTIENDLTQTRKKNNKEIRRIKRPLGITMMCRDLNNQEEDTKRYRELRKRIQRIWIQEWAYKGFQVNDKALNVQELAQKLGCREEMVVQGVMAPLYIMGKTAEDRAMATASLAFLGASNDRKLLLEQHQIMAKSQGGKYRPFISDGVQRGLALLDANTKTLLAIAKELKPAPEKGPKVQLNQALVTSNDPQQLTTAETGKFIGPNEAIKLLEANRPGGLHLLENLEAQTTVIDEALGLESESLPEVIATKQQGLGIDGHEGPIKKKVKKVHTDRNGPNILSSTIILPV